MKKITGQLKNWTILRFYSFLYLACCIIYSIAKWGVLSSGEGWGVVYMFGLISFGLIGLFLDYILRLIFRNKTILNFIGGIIAIGFSIELWKELN